MDINKEIEDFNQEVKKIKSAGITNSDLNDQLIRLQSEVKMNRVISMKLMKYLLDNSVIVSSKKPDFELKLPD